MIDHFSKDSCRTTGCSCCSSEKDVNLDKEDILKEARDNVRVAKKICEFYKIPFSKFCSDILTEKKCRKHEWYKKYQSSNSLFCRKCDKYKPEEEEKKK